MVIYIKFLNSNPAEGFSLPMLSVLGRREGLEFRAWALRSAAPAFLLLTMEILHDLVCTTHYIL